MSDYTILRVQDVPDFAGDAPGERRFFTRPLGSEQVAFTYVTLPAGAHYGPPGVEGFGHRHKEQEEIYFVISGTLTFRLGDELEQVGPRTAVRVAPATERAIRNEGSEDAEFVICAAKVEDARADAELLEGFWPE